VAFQFLLHRHQMLGQADRAARAVAVHMLHPLRQTDQFRQLFAVPLVKARQDVFDRFGSRRILPVAFAIRLRAQALQFLGQHVCIDAAFLRRIAQALVAAATEVELVLMEYAGCARNFASDVADGLIKQSHFCPR
jgi:hypothetical protein